MKRRILSIGLPVPNFNNIPKVLQNHSYWAVWKGVPRGNGKVGKPPMDPKTERYLATNSTEGWVSFDEVKIAYATGKFDGVGFLLTEEDDFFVVDVDDCIPNGWLSDVARDIIKTLKTYYEISPSGRGIHCIGQRGGVPITLPKNKTGNVECYLKERFMTVTGRLR